MNELPKQIYSGSKWEKEYAYCRALRRGSMVWVSGTTGTDPEGKVCSDSAAEQLEAAFKRISTALSKFEAGLEQLVRVRIYLRHDQAIEPVMQSFANLFRNIDPCATLLLVAGFIDESILVEIEAEAYLEL